MSDQPHTISRREFAALSLAVGATAVMGVSAATTGVTEADVQVHTPSGVCDAALIHPLGQGRWPGVILFVDAFGLRPVMRDMAKRLAVDGHTVLIPNPYYRSTKPPGLDPGFDFTNPADRAKLQALRAPLTSDAVMQDAIAYAKFLDAQSSVDKKAKMGVFGYCMGGPMTMQAPAALPERIGARPSFHGRGLVPDKTGQSPPLGAAHRVPSYLRHAVRHPQPRPEA